MTDLEGQTVVVIGGSAGIGLEAARLARVQYAEAILTRRNPDRLRDAADEFGARGTATFDPNDLPRLERYFAELPKPVDHVLVAVPRSRLLGPRRRAAPGCPSASSSGRPTSPSWPCT